MQSVVSPHFEKKQYLLYISALAMPVANSDPESEQTRRSPVHGATDNQIRRNFP